MTESQWPLSSGIWTANQPVSVCLCLPQQNIQWSPCAVNKPQKGVQPGFSSWFSMWMYLPNSLEDFIEKGGIKGSNAKHPLAVTRGTVSGPSDSFFSVSLKTVTQCSSLSCLLLLWIKCVPNLYYSTRPNNFTQMMADKLVVQGLKKGHWSAWYSAQSLEC